MNIFKKSSLLLFYCLIHLFASNVNAQVDVTMYNIAVNNIGSNNINLGISGTKTVTFKVKMTSENGSFDNIMGNLSIFTKKDTSSSPILRGYTSPTFLPPGAIDTKYISDNNSFTITLASDQFLDNGSVLYATFVNNNGNSFSSLSVPIVKSITTVRTICCDQTISEGNYPNISSINFSINGTQIQRKFLSGGDWQNVNYNTPLTESAYYRVLVQGVFTNTITVTVLPIYPGDISSDQELPVGEILQSPLSATRARLKTGQIWNERSNQFVPVYVYLTDFQWQIKINNGSWDNIPGATGPSYYYPTPMPELGYGKIIYFRRGVNYNGITMYTQSVQVRGIEHSVENIICCDQIITPSEQPGIIIGSDHSEPWIISSYSWQQAADRSHNNWITLYEYSRDLNPIPYLESQRPLVFRRVAIDNYLNYHSTSNEVKITVKEINNVICCDQGVIIGNPVDLIVGSVPSRLDITYQWQRGGAGTWSNISGAISKDYQPEPLGFRTSPGTGVKYRRIVTTPTSSYISNEAFIYRPSGRGRNGKFDNDGLTNDELTIYPNPASNTISIINVSETDDVILVFDITGREITGLKFTKFNDQIYNVDISNLANSTYIIKVGNKMKQFIKN